MKNLYVMFFLIISGNTYSQANLENANWIFGNSGVSWLDFNNSTLISPVSPSYNSSVTTLYNAMEGCASISDEYGQLLFFTDGKYVYKIVNNEIVIINFNSTNDVLYGSEFSSQNTVIIPKPNTEGRYFIITINSGVNSSVGSQNGLYWSELDINTNLFISINNVMSDELNNNFDNDFSNVSDAITTCIANNGIDFWIITWIKNNAFSKILSYKVTQNGINVTPSFSFEMPVGNISIPISLKISPSTLQLAVATSNRNPYLGTFDNNNGNIDVNLIPIGTNINNLAHSTYSIEFSPDNQILYYSRWPGVPVTISAPTGIFAVNLNDTNNEIQVVGTNINNNMIGTLQRGLNNKLYAAILNENYILEISNPNVFNNWNINTIPLGNGNSNHGLPQWIWTSCKNTLTLTSPQNNVDDYNLENERLQWIKASNIISSNTNASAILHAGNFVELNNGFEGVFGSQFAGYIQGCTNNFVYREQVSDTIKNSEDIFKPTNLTIYPNPSSSIIQLKLNNSIFSQIAIASIDGKIIHQENINVSDNYTLDISRYASGIYLINVSSNDGQQYSQKFVKN